MNENYGLMQYFLDMIKEFAVSNPNRTITEDFVYSNLMGFNVRNDQLPFYNIESNFVNWKLRYKTNNNLKVFEVEERPFLWFSNGKITGNEVKLYIPMDYNHIKEGANQLFDFISSTGMIHQSKIAAIIRNDNVVVRVTNLEDANKIINFVNNNNYIKEGMIKVNPFLPNNNGVGIAMDNSYSYNFSLCKAISDFVERLKNYNRLDLVTVEEFNKYVTNYKETITDLDLKDIYTLISKTTSKDYKYQNVVDHIDNKLSDHYTSDRKRITDPVYYFEKVITLTEQYHPGNSKTAILEYLKGNPIYFTNKNRARRGLLKYVKPGDLIWIMRSKLQQNNIQIPSKDQELVDMYLNLVLKKQNNYMKDFEIIKNAYTNTLNSYSEMQAQVALKELILNNDIQYFTNRFNDRTNLKNNILGKDVKRIILSNIDINNLNINNIDFIVSRFEESTLYNQNRNKMY